MSFRHDSTGIDPDDTSTVALVPEGLYTLKIFEAVEQVSSNGNNMVQVKCHIVNLPEFKEAELWHWVVFIEKGEKGDGISVMFRKAIGVPFGGDDIINADDWVGKKFQANVIQESYKDKKGTTRKRNKIETFSVKSLSESVAVGATSNGKGSPSDDDDVPF